mgnify:CR=1 FL=1
MFLPQLAGDGVVMREGDAAHLLSGVTTTLDLADAAVEAGLTLADMTSRMRRVRPVDLPGLAGAGAPDLPIHHPDPAHMHLTGTGLTHTGSADTRDAIHADTAGMTDSMKMFGMGVEGGRPAPGTAGVQPEWFYKGTGHAAVPPCGALEAPGFADDAGDKPEIAGISVIGPAGEVLRLGFCLAIRSRITRWSASTLSGSPIPNGARRHSGPSCASATFPRTCRAPRASDAVAG